MTHETWVHRKQHTGTCAMCDVAYGDLNEFPPHPSDPDQTSTVCRTCTPVVTQKVAAQQELYRRELIRRRLVNFIKAFVPNYDAGWVHKLICAKLERFVKDVEDKKSPRAMFFQPPRTGKSTIVSKALPPWVLGRHPEWEFISASYAVSLPEGFSRWIKQVLETPEYQALFPETKLDPNAKATSGWFTTKQGMYLPVGVGGGATGKGAHIFNIDDPVKDMTEADSETTLQAIWDWYDSVADTRISPGGGTLITMTRWSDLDLAGRLIQQEKDALKEIEEQRAEATKLLQDQFTPASHRDDARKRLRELGEEEKDVIRWDVISFPAMAEHDEYLTTEGNLVDNPYVTLADGSQVEDPTLRRVRRKNEALHPARYDESFYRRKKKSSQPRVWTSLFQQKPVPDEGVYFKKSNFRYEAHVAPWHLYHVYAAWDLAIGQKQQSDWTVGLIAALDFNGRLHILDEIRERTTEPAQLMFDSMRPYSDNLQMMGIEQGQIQQSVMPVFTKLVNDKTNGYPLVISEDLKPITDKTARARPAQGWCQQGKILLPADQPWVEDFVAELLRFPNGVWDDRVDALAWLVRMVVKQQPPKRPDPKPQKSWKDNLQRFTNGSTQGIGGHMSA